MKEPPHIKSSNSKVYDGGTEIQEEDEAKCCKITTIATKNENKTLAAFSLLITTMNFLNVLYAIQEGFESMYEGEEEIY